VTRLEEADGNSALVSIPAGCFGIDHVLIRGVGWSRSLDYASEASSGVVWTSDSRPALSGPTNLVVLGGGIPDLSEMKKYIRFIDVSALPSRSLGQGNLSGCELLERLRIPAGIEMIPKELCDGCFRLRDVNFGDLTKLVSIHPSAFSDCRSIHEFATPVGL
jgi:hypothetical protein